MDGYPIMPKILNYQSDNALFHIVNRQLTEKVTSVHHLLQHIVVVGQSVRKSEIAADVGKMS